MKRGFLNTQKAAKSTATKSTPKVTQIKLPYGKVDTTLPADYKPTPLKFTESHGSTLTYAENTTVFTTLPPDELTDNRTECILRGGAAKRNILATPGFPAPLPKPDKPSYRIEITPTTGELGMVATRHLKMGDLILSERPLSLVCRELQTDVNVPASTPMAQRIQAALREWETTLDVGVKRMSTKNQDVYRSLANSHTDDGSGPLLGILRTNGFGVSLGKDEQGDRIITTAVYAQTSRINHSCTPNVCNVFNITSFSGQLRAVRDIKEGEEIFVAYCDVDMLTADRQKKLEPYGFQCACRSCKDPKSDGILRAIIDSTKGMEGYRPMGSRADEARRLEESLKWLEKIEEQGLQQMNAYERHMEAVIMASMALGKIENINKYGPLRSARQNATSGNPLALMMF